MLRLLRIAIAFGATAVGGNAAMAVECTDYEKQIQNLADDAKIFQESRNFKELGFTAKGQKDWLERMQALRDNPQSDAFFAKHDFSAVTVYSVADEYRTAGRLDDFYHATEKRINAMPRCD